MDQNENDDVVDPQVDEVVDQNEPEDRGKNMQAEFSRKIQRQNELIAQQDAKLNELLEQLRTQTQQATPAVEKKPLKDLVFDDADAFANEIQQRAINAANAIVDERVRVSAQSQNVIAEMQGKYSEFAQPNSEATAKALEIANRQRADLKGTPEGIRLAMLEAAAELALIPASRKKQTTQNSDDFSIGSSGAPRQRRTQADPKKDIDPMTLAFAEALGIDTKDPKRLEGLSVASKRTNYNRYG